MHTLTIKRPVTIALLLIVTIAIIAITLWMSGRSYSNLAPLPFEDLRHLAKRLESPGRQVSMYVVAVVVVPIVANILLFMPFGFLLFIALYTVERPTMQTYILTLLIGFTFTCGIEAWQYFLPSRVADVNDVIWNTAGTLAGAILGHLRERVRFEFA
jgi:VanZ family protein